MRLEITINHLLKDLASSVTMNLKSNKIEDKEVKNQCGLNIRSFSF